MRKQQGGMLEF